MPLPQAEYEAEKARLKAVRAAAGARLDAARRGPASRYSTAVQEYVAAQAALEAFYREHLGPVPTRAERRCAILRARGVTPVWEQPARPARGRYGAKAILKAILSRFLS